MSSVLTSIIAFMIALGVLITVHEYGHFWVARKLGVKVLKFSIGFGKPIFRRLFGRDKTEFVVAAVPLGGYVKMLDEREGEVSSNEIDRAFNRKPLASRAAIVVAGPLVNFLFAILAYWLMFVIGVPGLRPIVDDVAPDTIVGEAGLRNGDEIIGVGGKATPTWETVMMALLQGALNGQELELRVRSETAEERYLTLPLDKQSGLLDDQDLLSRLGLTPWRPKLPALVDRLVAGGAGEQSGLIPGDLILKADEVVVEDWKHWVEIVQSHPDKGMRISVQRDGELVLLTLTPRGTKSPTGKIGRIGAYVRVPEDAGKRIRTEVQFGPLAALWAAAAKTGEMSILTIKTLWKMVAGEVSVRNISGPLAIAEFAGQSASIGFSTFLGFLGLVSISLGVLNLLPVPVLDGGHLMYYLIEFLKGSPVSERMQLFGQQVGIAALLLLMSLAFYNDIIRLLE